MSYPVAALVGLLVMVMLIGWSRTSEDCVDEGGVLVRGVGFHWYECVAKP